MVHLSDFYLENASTEKSLRSSVNKIDNFFTKKKWLQDRKITNKQTLLPFEEGKINSEMGWMYFLKLWTFWNVFSIALSFCFTTVVLWHFNWITRQRKTWKFNFKLMSTCSRRHLSHKKNKMENWWKHSRYKSIAYSAKLG